MQHKNRRGNSDLVVTSIVGLGIGVIVIAVIAIMLGAFRDDIECQTGYTFNSSANNCYQDTNHSAKQGLTYEYNVTTDGLTFLDNATSKFSTAGTIVGVLFLLSILAVGGFGGYAMYRKMKN